MNPEEGRRLSDFNTLPGECNGMKHLVLDFSDR